LLDGRVVDVERRALGGLTTMAKRAATGHDQR
jgi:hypothetical protein